MLKGCEDDWASEASRMVDVYGVYIAQLQPFPHETVTDHISLKSTL
jgi:hypothetical protein